MVVPIGSKVPEMFLTQNEQRSFGSEKGRSEFHSNKKFSKHIADDSDAVKGSTQQREGTKKGPVIMK